jgi:F0F1-type ATP synthase assembly protein I
MLALKTLPYRILLAQACAGAVVAIALLASGPAYVLAALLGMAVVVLPNALLALQLQIASQRGDSAARMLGQGFAKFVLTITLVAVALSVIRPEAVGFFAGLGAAVLAQIIAPALLRSPKLGQVPRLSSSAENAGAEQLKIGQVTR